MTRRCGHCFHCLFHGRESSFHTENGTAIREEGKSDELQRQADILRQSLNADIHFLQTPFYNISSTQIRQMDPKALAGQHLVPRSVLQYICEHHLYEEGVQANE